MPNDDKLLKLWNNLRDANNGVSNYLTVPEYDVFRTSFYQPEKRQKLYNNLKSIESNINLTIPDYEEFELIGLGNSVDKSNGKGNVLDAATIPLKQTVQSGKDVLGFLSEMAVGTANLVTGFNPFARSKINEFEKRGIEEGGSGYEPERSESLIENLGSFLKPKTEKEKIEYEINQNIQLKKVNKELQEDYAEMHNQKVRTEKWFIDKGLLDPQFTNSFWGNQAYSLGMNLPFVAVGGGARALGMKGLQYGIEAIGYPLFTIAESNALQGEVAGLTGEKDKDGYVKPGTIDIDKVQSVGPLGIIAGLFEFWGPHQALKIFQQGSKLSTKELLKSIGKTSFIEATEEGLYQNPIEQFAKISIANVQDDFNWDENLESWKGGFVGGLILSGPGTFYNAAQVKNIKKNIIENKEQILSKVNASPFVTAEKKESMQKAFDFIEKANDDELVDALNNSSQHISQAVKDNNDGIQLYQKLHNEYKESIKDFDKSVREKKSRLNGMVWKENDESIDAVLQRGFNSIELKNQFTDAVQSSKEFTDLLNTGITNDEIWKTLVQMPNNQQITPELRLQYENLYNQAIAAEAFKEQQAETVKKALSTDVQAKDIFTDEVDWVKDESKAKLEPVKADISFDLQGRITKETPLQIFTDGSDIKGTGKVGSGVWFDYKGKVYRKSTVSDVEEFKKKYNIDDNVSNPTMEMVALVNALEEFKNSKEHLEIFSDYEGVQKWLSGEWKAKKVYIKDLVNNAKQLISQIESNGGSVKLTWTKGHAGLRGNEAVDLVAKDRNVYNEIPNFFASEAIIPKQPIQTISQSTNVPSVQSLREWRQTGENVQEQIPAIPKLKGKMVFAYGKDKRSDITASTTFDAIKLGERTATTRYESEGHIDYWKTAKVGDIIEVEGQKGQKQLVKVTKEIHKLEGSGKTPEQWSKLEGWNTDYFEKKVKSRLSEAWQIEFEPVKEQQQVQKPLVVSDVHNLLKERDAVDPDTEKFNEWILNYAYGGKFKLGGLEVKVLANGELIGYDKNGVAQYMTPDTPGAYHGKTVFLNENNPIDKSFYNYLSHEVLHPILNAALNSTSKSYNVEFFNQVNALYKEAQIRFQTDQKDFYLANKADIDNAMENIFEFADYMMVPTNVFHQWARRTPLTNNSKSTLLQKFIAEVKRLLSWLYKEKTDFVTFYEAMSTAFNKQLSAPSPMKFYDFVYSEVDQFGLQEGKEVHEQYFNANDDLSNDRAVRAVGRLLMRMNGITNTDPIKYIQSLSLKKFREMLEPKANVPNSEQYDKLIAILYEKSGSDLPYFTFKERIQTQQYNQALNKKQMPTIILNRIDPNASKIEECADTYLSRNNMRKTTWQTDMPIFEYVPILNQMFGTEFEVVYIDGIRTADGIKGINEFDDMPRNRTFTQELLNHGYYYLGTWADKDTSIALRTKQSLNQQSVQEMVKLYQERIKQFAAAYPNTDIGTPEDYIGTEEEYSTLLIPKLLRIITHDIALGARYVEGAYQPALWNPAVPESGDAKKILKRVPQVGKKYHITEDEDLINDILREVGKNEQQLAEGGYGVFVNKDGHLAFNQVIFDGQDIKPGEYFLEFDFHGIPIKADLYNCLINRLGTARTDGINYYLRKGWGQAYETLYGVIKEGSKKAWQGNLVGDDPMFGKGSWQVVSEDDPIGQWMLKNNISILTSSTTAKIKNPNKVSSLVQIAQGDVSKMFQTEFRTVHRQGEKNVVNDDAKGLVQSLNTNQTFESNKYDANQKKMLEATTDIIKALSKKFTDDVTKFDLADIVRTLKYKALNGVSDHERTQAQIILNLAYHLADEKFYNLETNLFLSEEAKKKLRLDQLLGDEKVANELGNLFMDPYFSHPIKSYIRERLEDMYGMRTSLEWGTLRPDIGWLSKSNLEEVWKGLEGTDEERMQKFQEIINLESGTLKSGYAYFSDSHRKLGLKIGDKAVLTIVPSTSMVSQYAVKVAAFLPKTSAEPDSITAESVDIQTYGGRDFDIDQMSIFYQKDKFVSKEAFDKFWEVVEERWNNHKKYLLHDYRSILSKPELREADLFTEETRVAIARMAARMPRETAKVQNPFTRLFEINDKFQKYVGKIIPGKKITTILGEINARTHIGDWQLKVRHSQVSNNYLAYDIFTHHAVDIPSDTGGMMYQLTNERMIDMRYGLGRQFNGIHDNMVEAYEQGNYKRYYSFIVLSRGISIAEDFLIGSVTKINNPYNQDNFGEEKGLAEDYTYIKRQQEIIQLLEGGNKEQLLQKFNNWFNGKYASNLEKKPEFWSRIQRMARLYIQNFEFNSLTDSVSLNLIRAIPLDIVPQTLISSTVYTKWENDVLKHFQDKYGYTEKVKQIYDTRKEISKYDKLANKWLMATFLSTENSPLHATKAALISLILPVDQTQRDTTKIDFNFNPKSNVYLYDNIFKYVAPATFGPLFNLALQNRTMIFNGKANEAVLKTEAGNQLTLKRGSNDTLYIEALDLSNGKVGRWESGMEFLQADSQFAMRVKSTFGLSNNLDSTNLLTADNPIALLQNQPTVEQMQLASDNRYRINQLFSFGPNIPWESRVNLAEQFLRKILPQLSKEEKYELFISLLGHPDPGEILLTPLNLIANTRESKSNYRFPTQSTLMELLGRLGEYEFIEEYGKAKSQLYPGSLGFKAKLDVINEIENSDDINSGNEIWYARNSDIQSEVNNEKNDWISNYETIYNIIRSTPRKVIKRNDFVFPNILTGQMKLMDDKYIYQTAIAPFNTEFAGAINLEAVQLSKIKYLGEHLNIISGWFDSIHTAYKNSIQNIYETLEKKVSKSDIWKDINTKLDQGIYGNIQIGRKEANWIFYFNNTEYTNLNKLADDYGITDAIEKEKFKAVMELRKVYDFTDVMLARNISSYLNNVLNSPNLPADFQNRQIISSLYNKWSSLADRMQARIGKYFPRMFTPEGSDKVMHRHAAYELLKEMHPKTEKADLIQRARNWQSEPEEFRKKVEERFTAFSVNKLEGKIYSWMKARSVPDEFIDEGDYVVENDAMHMKHQKQLINAIRDDIAKVEWLQYEFEAHMAGISDKVINRMHKWFANNTMDRYMHAQKIGYDQAKSGNSVGFYYTNANGIETYYRGVVANINKNEVELEIDKEIFEKKVKADLEYYAEQHDQIVTNPFIEQSAKATDAQLRTLEKLLGETYIQHYNQDVTILEANDLIYQGLQKMLEDKNNWGKFRRDKIYIKQYSKDGKSVKTNGFERAIYDGWVLNRIDDLNLLSSVAFLGSPGSGFGNATDALYRVVQAIGYARYFKLWILNTESAREANKKFAEARKTGSFEVYNQTLRPYLRGEKVLDDQTVNAQLEVAFATAAQYILEHGYAKKTIAAGTEYEGLESKQSVQNIKGQASKFGLWFFGTAEAGVRRHSAFMFAAKAVLVDKIMDPKKIYEVIEKGVMRANSEYSPWARKLGDSGTLGNLLFKFSQFNTDQFSNFLMQIEAGKQQGQIQEVIPKLTQGELIKAAEAMGFNIKTMLHKKAVVTSPINDTTSIVKGGTETDPIILRRIIKEAIQDTIIASLFMPLKGLRTGNPVTKTGILASVFLMNLIFSGEGPDDWDFKDWIFGILSIFTGMGIQIPLQLLYQLATDADEISIGNPRVGTGLVDAYNALTGDDLLDSKKVVKNSWYQYGKLSKGLLRFDITPHTRTYYNETLNKLTARGLLGVSDQVFNFDTYLPIYNLMEYYQK